MEKHQAQHGTCPQPRGSQQSEGDGVWPGSRSRTKQRAECGGGRDLFPAVPSSRSLSFQPWLSDGNFRRSWCRAGQASGGSPRAPTRREGSPPGTRRHPPKARRGGVRALVNRTAPRPPRNTGGPAQLRYTEGVSFDKNRNTQRQRSLTMREKRKRQCRAVSASPLATWRKKKKKKKKAVSWTTPALQLSVP